MKIAVTGYMGYVGNSLVREHKCEPVMGDILSEMDMHNADKTIDLVIHCAAMTNVDACEKDKQTAFKVNVYGTMNVVNNFHCPIVYLSTDHVFNGKPRLWSPNEKTAPDPVNVYGMTKYAGETMALTSTYPVLIVRSSKLFDYSTIRADVELLRSGKSREFTGVIKRNFTHRDHFVNMLMKLAKMDWGKFKGNIIHVASPMTYSYYEFWKLIAEELNLDVSLIKERKYPLDAAVPRPFHGGLDTRKLMKLMYSYSVADGLNLVKKEIENEKVSI